MCSVPWEANRKQLRAYRLTFNGECTQLNVYRIIHLPVNERFQIVSIRLQYFCGKDLYVIFACGISKSCSCLGFFFFAHFFHSFNRSKKRFYSLDIWKKKKKKNVHHTIGYSHGEKKRFVNDLIGNGIWRTWSLSSSTHTIRNYGPSIWTVARWGNELQRNLAFAHTHKQK